MVILSAERIGKSYTEKQLFDDLSFGIEAGARIGLIGVNGSGKSTLLKVVAGVEPPDSGQIVRRGGIRVAYLPQQPVMDDDLTVRDYMWNGATERLQLVRDYDLAAERLRDRPDDPAVQQQLHDLSARMDAADAWTIEAQVHTILTQLGVNDLDQRLGVLSGGQRRRVAMAQALLDPADLIILDEPTNHLDADTVDWLETLFGRISSALLLVTHDRYFLDRLVRQTWELDRGKLHQYDGGYSRFLEQKAARQALQNAERDRQTTILRRELAWLRQGPQGRGTKQKARIERIDSMRDTPEVDDDPTLSIALGTQRLGKRVLDLKHVTKSYDQRTVLDDVSITFEPGSRWGIVGPNGAGKSTLLNLLADRIKPDRGEVVRGETVHLAYYDQESSELDPQQRVIDYVTDAAHLIRTTEGEIVTANQMLEQFLFPAQAQYAPVGTLSGGERRRLYLLRTLMLAPNVLLLDEPSNDLDVQTLAVLEAYLDRFRGTLIVASHDRYFLDRTVDQLIVLSGDGRLRTFPGSYSAYAADRRQREAQDRQTQAVKAPPPAPRPSDPVKPRKLSFKEQREYATIEARIAELEARQAQLNDTLSSGTLPYDELQRVSTELVAIGEELERTVERWAELAEIAEATA